MDEFFKKIRNNEHILKKIEVKANPDEEDDEANDGSPLMKESHPDNFKFVGSVPKSTNEDPMKEVVGSVLKPTNEDPLKENVIRKPTRIGEADEEYKFSNLMETSQVDAATIKKELKEEAEYEPNLLEKMLEEAGETIDFLS